MLNEKEERILEAAQKLFSRFGPRKTSIDEIAQQAGLGKGTIYLYFRSKDELHAAIVRRIGESLLRSMEEAKAAGRSPAEKLRLLVAARLRFIEEHIEIHELTPEVIQEFEENERSPLLGPIIREMSQTQIKMIYDLIAEGIQAGNFVADDPQTTAVALYAALHTCGKPWPCEGEMKICTQDKITALMNLFLYGLTRRSGEHASVPPEAMTSH